MLELNPTDAERIVKACSELVLCRHDDDLIRRVLDIA